MRAWFGCLILVVLESAALGQPSAVPPPVRTTPLFSPDLAQRLAESIPNIRQVAPASQPKPSVWTVKPVSAAPLIEEFPYSRTRPPSFPSPLPLPLSPSASALQSALDELKNVRQQLANDRKDSSRNKDEGPVDDVARLKMRVQIADLLRRLEERGKQPVTPVKPSTPSQPIPPGPVTPPVTDGVPMPSDPLALAEAQYRAEQFETALKALERVRRDDLSRRDQTWVSYLKAGCLRRLGKTQDAAAVYREIAAARDDTFLSEMAVWHLGFLAWREQVESGIEKLKRGTP